MKTWKSSEQSIKEGSSIVDSHEQSAADKFGETVSHETTDKSTKNSKENWHAEAEVSASWGWGKAKVSGGGGANISPAARNSPNRSIPA